MESNVFTIIGNRMKGRRACWSINGGNNIAALLCKHYSVDAVSWDVTMSNEILNTPLSAAKAPKSDGKGYEFYRNISIPAGLKWLKSLSACISITDL